MGPKPGGGGWAQVGTPGKSAGPDDLCSAHCDHPALGKLGVGGKSVASFPPLPKAPAQPVRSGPLTGLRGMPSEWMRLLGEAAGVGGAGVGLPGSRLPPFLLRENPEVGGAGPPEGQGQFRCCERRWVPTAGVQVVKEGLMSGCTQTAEESLVAVPRLWPGPPASSPLSPSHQWLFAHPWVYPLAEGVWRGEGCGGVRQGRLGSVPGASHLQPLNPDPGSESCSCTCWSVSLGSYCSEPRFAHLQSGNNSGPRRRARAGRKGVRESPGLAVGPDTNQTLVSRSRVTLLLPRGGAVAVSGDLNLGRAMAWGTMALSAPLGHCQVVGRPPL